MTAGYASRRSHFNPASMGAALAINGGVLAALFFAAPQVFVAPDDPDIQMIDIALPKPPPPPEPQPPTERAAQPQPSNPVAPLPPLPLPPSPNSIDTTTLIPLFPPPPLPLPNGTADTPGPIVEVPAELPLAAATRDARYARDFQPDYPAAERRAEREGTATVRIPSESMAGSSRSSESRLPRTPSMKRRGGRRCRTGGSAPRRAAAFRSKAGRR